MALDAINNGLAAGELEQNEDGSISASKRRPDATNLIGNFEDFWACSVVTIDFFSILLINKARTVVTGQSTQLELEQVSFKKTLP